MIQVNHRAGAAAPTTIGTAASPGRKAELATRSLPAAAAVSPVGQSAQKGAAYPDRPLISSEPLRYNVQLNQQLTVVQQADGFLLETEKQLLQLNHLIARRGPAGEVVKQAETLQQLLSKRESLSGGAVDRQLHLSLQSQPTVNFSLQDGAALLHDERPEVLTFSLAGRQRTISAAELDGSSPQQNLLRLNQALGKWGIHGQLSGSQLNFEVGEQRWPEVSQHLSVQGSGERYPQGQFYPLKPQVESGLDETLQQLVRSPGSGSALLGSLEESLETVTRQRRALQGTRSRVQQRIDSMATFNGPSSALQAAEEVAVQLRKADFSGVSQALAGQANVQGARVRNVLAAA